MTDIKTTDELKRLSRRIEEIGKTIDLLFNDRELLEDILNRLTTVESALNLNRSTAIENAKNAKADTKEIKEAVEAKVDEVTDHIDENTLIVKSPKESVIQKIINKVSGK